MREAVAAIDREIARRRKDIERIQVTLNDVDRKRAGLQGQIDVLETEISELQGSKSDLGLGAETRVKIAEEERKVAEEKAKADAELKREQAKLQPVDEVQAQGLGQGKK